MAYFVDENNTYFEGDIEYERAQGRICTEVPQSPGRLYEWTGTEWQRKEDADQTLENEARAKAAGIGVELNLKDSEGDVRWRIVPNAEGKLQVEVDPVDSPHIGEWLLNGVIGIPRLEEGELLICLDGKLKGICIKQLKELIDSEQ